MSQEELGIMDSACDWCSRTGTAKSRFVRLTPSVRSESVCYPCRDAWAKGFHDAGGKMTVTDGPTLGTTVENPPVLG